MAVLARDAWAVDAAIYIHWTPVRHSVSTYTTMRRDADVEAKTYFNGVPLFFRFAAMRGALFHAFCATGKYFNHSQTLGFLIQNLTIVM